MYNIEVIRENRDKPVFSYNSSIIPRIGETTIFDKFGQGKIYDIVHVISPYNVLWPITLDKIIIYI